MQWVICWILFSIASHLNSKHLQKEAWILVESRAKWGFKELLVICRVTWAFWMCPVGATPQSCGHTLPIFPPSLWTWLDATWLLYPRITPSVYGIWTPCSRWAKICWCWLSSLLIDLCPLLQLYDFSAPKECPCAISYHPSQQVFACGFETGAVRIFNVAKTSLLAEHKSVYLPINSLQYTLELPKENVFCLLRQHRGKVVGLAFAPHGDYLYSAGSLGSLAIYDCYGDQYRLIRLLGNTLAKGETHGPHALAVSPDGSCVAFVGPTDFTISVVDGRSLDEVMHHSCS